jgi:hypothetical protein
LLSLSYDGEVVYVDFLSEHPAGYHVLSGEKTWSHDTQEE